MSDSNVPNPEVGAHADPNAGTRPSADGAVDRAIASDRIVTPDLAVAEVASRARRGDGEARRWLFERFREVAFRVALRITGNEADAMDVVQDAYIKAFGSLDSLADGGRFKTWLLRIVNNKALDLLRSRKVRKAVSLQPDDEQDGGLQIPADTEDDPSGALSGRETQERVAAALEALPPDQRSVLSLFAAGSMTYGEIAETVGVPLGTVMSRLYRARRQMKEMLPEYDVAARKKAPRKGPVRNGGGGAGARKKP